MKKFILVFLFFSIMLQVGAQYQIVSSGPFATLTRLAAVPLVFVWFVDRISRKRLRVPNSVLIACFFYIGWTFLSILWCPDPNFGIGYVVYTLSGLALGWIAWDQCRDNRSLRIISHALIAACWLLFLVSLKNAIMGNNMYTDRVAASTFDPNEVSFFMALVMPIAWFLATSKEPYNKFLRFLNFIFPGIVFITNLLTASRGGLLAFLTGAICISFMIPRTWKTVEFRKPIIQAFSLAIACVAIILAKAHIAFQVQRLLAIGSSGSTDQFTGRLPVWKAVLQIIHGHSLLGAGAAGVSYFDTNAPVPHVMGNEGIIAHNTPLDVAGNYGLIGLALFCAIFYFLIRNAMKKEINTLHMAISFTAIFAVGAFAISIESRPQLWVILNICAAIVCGWVTVVVPNVAAESRRRRLTTDRLVPAYQAMLPHTTDPAASK